MKNILIIAVFLMLSISAGKAQVMGMTFNQCVAKLGQPVSVDVDTTLENGNTLKQARFVIGNWKIIVQLVNNAVRLEDISHADQTPLTSDEINQEFAINSSTKWRMTNEVPPTGSSGSWDSGDGITAILSPVSLLFSWTKENR